MLNAIPQRTAIVAFRLPDSIDWKLATVRRISRVAPRRLLAGQLEIMPRAITAPGATPTLAVGTDKTIEAKLISRSAGQ